MTDPTDPRQLLEHLANPGERRLAVRVTDDAMRWVRSGHPWLYEDSITSITADGHPGDLAVIFDSKRRFQAIGLYDPTSPIRVKILHHGKPVTIDAAWFRARIVTSIEKRRGLVNATKTTGIRLVNGENDGLPGLVVDRYEDVGVVKVYSSAWLAHLRDLLAALGGEAEVATVILRLARRIRDEVPDGVVDGMALIGSVPDGPVLFRENGLRVEADVVAGNKTGYFLDQRVSRRFVGDASRGARVLDVFSSSGGFSLAAAAGGASSVLSVDTSGPALQAAQRNFTHNHKIAAVQRCRHTIRRSDAFEAMADLADRHETFDVVVVDPPSFAQSEADVAKALRAYRRLTNLAVSLTASGGLLVQASCSSRVQAHDFFHAVTDEARRSGVELHEVRRTGHPPDHPIGFKEGAYLKAIFARIERPEGDHKRR